MFTVRVYEAGEVVFRENEYGETAYIIERGRVEVLKTNNGKKVHLAFIGPGEPFGEMGMIDEKPRSATVIAAERTEVREIHRDDFVNGLRTHPEKTIALLKILFERLREANATILELNRRGSTAETPAHSLAPVAQRGTARGIASQHGVEIQLEGLTPEAMTALPEKVLRITKFPFRIGRHSQDGLVHNDLSIKDKEPLYISRHHVTFFADGIRVRVSDRGSRLGSLVDGTPIGGEGNPSTFVFSNPSATLVLGDQSSPYRFKVSIKV